MVESRLVTCSASSVTLSQIELDDPYINITSM